uniref:Uncharacterized protein n=2 Tax=unclassified bacterial viruses TaxID=12333 RepID=A0AAU6VY68_9VIRU
MNVMKEAHKAVREAFANVGYGIKLEYRPLFRAALIDLHKINKEANAMQTPMTVKASNVKELLELFPQATGFAIVGTVASEGKTVYVGESSGSEVRMQSDATYYMNAKNGYSKQELFLELYGVHGVTKSFQITH